MENVRSGLNASVLIRCFSHSSPPLSFPLPRPVQLQPLKLQCITRMVRSQRKQYPRSPVTPTRHDADGAAMAGYRDIRARTDTQGSTLMARATGGSSKVTYPRKPRVSFPFTRAGSPPLSGRSRATYIYLHTFLSMTESRPPPTTRELELLDPAWCVQQTNRRCRSG